MKRLWTLFISLFLVFLIIFYLSSRVLAFFGPYFPFTDYLLGVHKPASYLILLGNDAEMRANGGFAGSYAKITLSPQSPLSNPGSRVPPREGETAKPRGISPHAVIPAKAEIHQISSLLNFKPSVVELDFQDIYVPNGQIQGLFVTPPEPIQQAFGHGTWELANADWEPDFPSAAKSLRWFLEKGKETNPDILAILNLSTIKKILTVVGSFPVPEYKATLTPDNLYLFLQGKAELNFFPGSTQKKDALTAVGQALVKKVKSLSLIQKFKIAQILYDDLQNQNIVLHSLNPNFQSFLVEKNFAGVFQPEAMDTYAMIETNLGANKANAYVSRETDHQISFANGQVHHTVNIKFQNASLEANPNPPFHYGGDYSAYLRLYIPENAQNITLTRSPEGKPPLSTQSPLSNPGSRVPSREGETPSMAAGRGISPSPVSSPSANLSSENYDLRSAYGLTELGFWHKTTAGNGSTISLTYDLPLPNQEAYTLAILKQHGLVTSPQAITLFGQPLATSLSKSYFHP